MQNGKIETSTIIPVAVVVFFIGGLIWLFGGSTNTTPQNTGTWSMGNMDSQIELVEFSDLECPACAVAQPTVKAIVEKYEDQIKFTYKHFPLRSIHPKAYKFSVAAEAAGNQGKFFEFIDMAFANHDNIFNSSNPESRMLELAKGIEALDFEKFKREFEDEKYKGDVLEDEKEAMDLKLNSTPSFLLNGEVLQLNTFADLDIIIQQKIDSLTNATEINNDQNSETPTDITTEDISE